jgi:hypothetical protein
MKADVSLSFLSFVVASVGRDGVAMRCEGEMESGGALHRKTRSTRCELATTVPHAAPCATSFS